MKYIFSNLGHHWKTMILIFIFLVAQAYCDLSLPEYTQDIIDTGIQNKGISHVVPMEITEEEYSKATLFMTENEKSVWESLYEKKGEEYHLKKMSDEKIDKADDDLITAMVTTYQLGHMPESQFKEMVKESLMANPATAPMAEKVDSMSSEELGKLMGAEIKSFKGEDAKGKKTTLVDIREAINILIKSGKMDRSATDKLRNSMEELISKSGKETVKSMGIAYAAEASKKAGVDIDHLQTSYLWKSGFRMVAMAGVILLMTICVAYFASRVGSTIGKELRKKTFANIIGFSNREIDKFSTASLITRSTNDVQQIQLVIILMLRMIMYAPILGVGGVYKVYKTGANMGWVIGLALLMVLSFVGVLLAVAMPKFKIMQSLVDRLNLVSREILTGLPVIRAFGREAKEEARFDVANKKLTGTQLFTSRTMSLMMPGMMTIMFSVSILITWVAAHRIDDGTMHVGTMTAFITYTMQIIMSFLMLTMLSIMLPRAGVAADRIKEVVDTKSSITDGSYRTNYGKTQFERNEAEVFKDDESEEVSKGGLSSGSTIEFRNVSFKYDGAEEMVIKNISFVAEPNKVTAIIGSTGAGKSTIVNLIPRFYDVTEGEILLNGIDIRSLSLKELRSKIGFVPQKGVLFSGTINSNIAFGNDSIGEEKILKAAAIAQADEFISLKEEGYESFIAQGGNNVSGGQKQRLAIARAIAIDPDVLVFDDSFSALDMKTDAKLRKELDKHLKGKTEIIVAQRISTIIHADQILVLDDGVIVGKGTHEELLKNCSVYEQIARSQLSARELGLSEEVM